MTSQIKIKNTAVPRGRCGDCSLYVWTRQPRCKDNGQYYHLKCPSEEDQESADAFEASADHDSIVAAWPRPNKCPGCDIEMGPDWPSQYCSRSCLHSN